MCPAPVACSLPVHRNVAYFLVGFAATAFLAGCGSGSAGVSTGPVKHPVNMEFAAYAHAVNLRAGDAPGLEAGSPEQEVHAPAAEDELARCIGVARQPATVVRIASAGLGDGDHIRVGSSVATRIPVRPLTSKVVALTARDLAAIGSRRGISCSGQYALHVAQAEGIKDVHVTPLPNPLNGTDGSVALRFRVAGTIFRKGSSAPIPVEIYEDVIVFDSGGVEIELGTGSAPSPFPLATERSLLSLLYNRAQAHKP